MEISSILFTRDGAFVIQEILQEFPIQDLFLYLEKYVSL